MAADPAHETDTRKRRERSPPEGWGKKRLILIRGSSLVIAGAGAVFFFAPDLVKGLPLLGTRRGPERRKKEGSLQAGVIYDLDPFLVNLADTDPSRYLKIRINIESHRIEGEQGGQGEAAQAPRCDFDPPLKQNL